MTRRIPLILISLALLGFLAWWLLGNRDTDVPPDLSPATAEVDYLLQGEVIDHTGRPLPQASVQAGELLAQTDDRGRFGFTELPSDPFDLDVRAPGYSRHAPGTLTLDPASLPDDDFKLILFKDALIRGQIVAHGRPVADAEISLSFVFAESLTGELLEPFISSALVTTDGRGRFELPQLASGRLHILVETPHYPFFEGEEIYLRPGQELTGLRYDIATSQEEVPSADDEATDISGRVLASSGRGLLNARVVFSTPDGQAVRTLRTDAAGEFVWADAPALPMSVQAFGPGHDPSDVFEVRPGQTIELQLKSGGAIQGLVVDSRRRPIPAYTISFAYAEPLLNRRIPLSELPSQDVDRLTGRFDLSPVPSGRYRLVVEAPGYALTTSDPIEVSPQRITGPIFIEIQTATTLEGTVFDLTTGEPIEGATIQHQVRRPSGGYHRTTSDVDGLFTFEGLPSGPQSFVVAHDDYIDHSFTNILLNDTGITTFDFGLQPQGDGEPGMSFEGIGAVLSRNDGAVVVRNTMQDSAAVRAGLEAGDHILAIDGQPTENLTLDQAIQKIRGTDGEPVTLDIRRPNGQTRSLEITRERVFIPRSDRLGTR